MIEVIWYYIATTVGQVFLACIHAGMYLAQFGIMGLIIPLYVVFSLGLIAVVVHHVGKNKP